MGGLGCFSFYGGKILVPTKPVIVSVLTRTSSAPAGAAQMITPTEPLCGNALCLAATPETKTT
jgi:hypothetical protein